MLNSWAAPLEPGDQAGLLVLCFTANALFSQYLLQGRSASRPGHLDCHASRRRHRCSHLKDEIAIMITEDQKAEFMAFTRHEAFAELAGYVARGRKFASLSNDGLTQRFVEVFRKVADNPANREHRAIKSCLEAEFQLRNINVPYELIAEDFERLRGLLIEHLNTMEREDPERYAEMNQEIACDFEQFLNERFNSN
jgi:hypothetical protein